MDDFGRAGSWCSSHCNGHLWAAQCCWELNLCLQTYRRSYQWDYRFPYHLSWKVISSQPQSFAQGRKKKTKNLWIPLRSLWKKIHQKLWWWHLQQCKTWRQCWMTETRSCQVAISRVSTQTEPAELSLKWSTQHKPDTLVESTPWIFHHFLEFRHQSRQLSLTQ